MKKVTRILIDGFPLLEDHFSGVGHYMQGIVLELDKLAGQMDDIEVSVVVSARRADRLQRYNFQNIKIRKYWIPHRLFLLVGFLAVPNQLTSNLIPIVEMGTLKALSNSFLTFFSRHIEGFL